MIYPIIWGKNYTPFECPFDRNLRDRPSEAYYCGSCGEVWARFLNDRFPNWWSFSRIDCDHCPPSPSGLRIPGSFIVPFDRPLFEALPPDLLRREVLLLAAHVKRFPNFTYL